MNLFNAVVLRAREYAGPLIDKAKINDDHNAQIATYELAVLLSQIGQSEMADACLEELGFTVKLSPEIFRPTGELGPVFNEIACAIDNSVPAPLLNELQTRFSKESEFWPDHNYPEETTFFSYNEPRGSGSAIDKIVDSVLPQVLNTSGVMYLCLDLWLLLYTLQ